MVRCTRPLSRWTAEPPTTEVAERLGTTVENLRVSAFGLRQRYRTPPCRSSHAVSDPNDIDNELHICIKS